MIKVLFVILLPIAAICGWWSCYRKYRHHIKSLDEKTLSLHRDYFVGLNYLIDEQPDKAVDLFIKMLEVDSDTVETHLALGNLFRKSGEVDRAIRIHQNIIARPQLIASHRVQALFELAQDYMRAGVLNRAEKLFLELVEMGERRTACLNYLLTIYQQQKDWAQAIVVAKKLSICSGLSKASSVAHYYCELAEECQNEIKVNDYLLLALKADKQCARASMLQARQAMDAGDYEAALHFLHRVAKQDPDFIMNTTKELSECYRRLNQPDAFITYLLACLDKHPQHKLALFIAELLQQQKNDTAAIELLADYNQQYPSVLGVGRLFELYSISFNFTEMPLAFLRTMLGKLTAQDPNYRCTHCGFSSKSLYWLCPGCNQWGLLRPPA